MRISSADWFKAGVARQRVGPISLGIAPRACTILSTVRLRGKGTSISEASKRVPIFPLLPREASKWVPIFDRGTGSKPEMLRSVFLRADLNLIV